MTWRFSGAVEEFAAAAGPLLAADPVGNTLALTGIENARNRPGGDVLFGWWTDPAGEVRGAVSHTPPYSLLAAHVPDPALESVVPALLDVRPELPGVVGVPDVAAVLARRWTTATGQPAQLAFVEQLYRLDRLVEPAPPDGAPGTAGEPDVAVVAELLDGFQQDTGRDFVGAAADPAEARRVQERIVRDRLPFGGWTLWVDGAGSTVALAGVNRTAAGAARIGPVYTKPAARGRGYGGAATVAAARAALSAGAHEVVLFTDVANATANALYRRLGFRPVGYRLRFRFVREPNPSHRSD